MSGIETCLIKVEWGGSEPISADAKGQLVKDFDPAARIWERAHEGRMVLGA